MGDGPVFAHEFQRTGVGAEHVVLSSCEVGRTHVRAGDEALGLTASLLATGVRTVVAAVGPVGDEDAHAVMTAYHRVLAQGLDAAEALEIASAGVEEGRLFCAYGADWASDVRRYVPAARADRRSDEQRGLGEQRVVGVLARSLGEADPSPGCRSRPPPPGPA